MSGLPLDLQGGQKAAWRVVDQQHAPSRVFGDVSGDGQAEAGVGHGTAGAAAAYEGLQQMPRSPAGMPGPSSTTEIVRRRPDSCFNETTAWSPWRSALSCPGRRKAYRLEAVPPDGKRRWRAAEKAADKRGSAPTGAGRSGRNPFEPAEARSSGSGMSWLPLVAGSSTSSCGTSRLFDFVA